MKSGNHLLSLGIALIVSLPILGINSTAQARSLEEIKQSGEIRFCIRLYSEWMIGTVEPEGCLGGNCEYQGTHREITEAFAQSLGENIQAKYWVVETIDELFHNDADETVREASYTPKLLASGTCDIYGGAWGRHEWRLNKIDIHPNFVFRSMIVVHKSMKDEIKTLADLAGKVTGSQEANKVNIHHLRLQKLNETDFPDNPIRFKFYPTDDAEIAALESGEVDFSTWGAAATLVYIRDKKYKNITSAFPIGQIRKSGWGYRKEDQDLQAVGKAFFEAQLADKNSALNQSWKKAVGISYGKYLRFVTRKLK